MRMRPQTSVAALVLRPDSNLGLGILAVWALAPVFAEEPWLAPKRLTLKSKIDAALVAIFVIAFLAFPCELRAIQDSDTPPIQSSDTGTQREQELKSTREDQSAPIVGITLCNPIQTKWKVGVKIVGASRPVQNVFISIPVPNGWPEQSVSVSQEDIPSTIGQVDFRNLESGVKQMIVAAPRLPAREEVTVTMTFVVATHQIKGPPDPSQFKQPKSHHKDGKIYLSPSPYTNFHDSRLKKQVKTLTADKPGLWEEIEAIYDWVRDNIEEVAVQPGDTVSVFRNKKGCSEDKVRLFIAMCRAHKIPARMVWVEGSFYAEFMLVDDNADAHWFPCSVIGIREFGSHAEAQVILQKGDNILVPEKGVRLKFVNEFMSCQGSSKPGVAFIRELLPTDQ